MKPILALLFCASQLSADWAEDRLSQMTLEEKIGQLFIVPACPQRGDEHLQDLQEMLEKYQVGGVILKQGTAEEQLRLIRWLQERSKVPLLCVADAEWGLGMRLSDTLSFPKNLALGALQDQSLIEKVGEEIGRQCKRVGIHLNLAPVVDVNSNADNPIIGMRSFGENPHAVAACGTLFMKGHEKGGTLTCAKHFPGHGDTSVDSHEALPSVTRPWDRLLRVELLPFKRLIKSGVPCVMTGHLLVPALDATQPATFSYEIVTEILKTTLGFRGVVISDALNMRALTNNFSSEEIALRAYGAGHDLLLYGDHIAPNVDAILREQVPAAFAALQGEDLADLDARVLKILRLKQKVIEPVPSEDELYDDLYSLPARKLKRELFRSAITLLKNENILPLKDQQIRWIHLGETVEEKGSFFPNLFVIELFRSTPENLHYAEQLAKSGIRTILVHYLSPYQLPQIDFKAIILAYSPDEDAQDAVQDLLFGKLKPQGRLPVTIPGYPRGSGL